MTRGASSYVALGARYDRLSDLDPARWRGAAVLGGADRSAQGASLHRHVGLAGRGQPYLRQQHCGRSLLHFDRLARCPEPVRCARRIPGRCRVLFRDPSAFRPRLGCSTRGRSSELAVMGARVARSLSASRHGALSGTCARSAGAQIPVGIGRSLDRWRRDSEPGVALGLALLLAERLRCGRGDPDVAICGGDSGRRGGGDTRSRPDLQGDGGSAP